MILVDELVKKYNIENTFRFEKVATHALKALLTHLGYYRTEPYYVIRHLPNTVYNMLAPIYGWEPAEAGEIKLEDDFLIDSGEKFYIAGDSVIRVDKMPRVDTFKSGNEIYIKQYGKFSKYLEFEPGDDIEITINQLKLKAKFFRIGYVSKQASLKINGKQWKYKKFPEYTPSKYTYSSNIGFDIRPEMLNYDAGVFRSDAAVLYKDGKIAKAYYVKPFFNDTPLCEIIPKEDTQKIIFALSNGYLIEIGPNAEASNAGKVSKSVAKRVNSKFEIRELKAWLK